MLTWCWRLLIVAACQCCSTLLLPQWHMGHPDEDTTSASSTHVICDACPHSRVLHLQARFIAAAIHSWTLVQPGRLASVHKLRHSSSIAAASALCFANVQALRALFTALVAMAVYLTMEKVWNFRLLATDWYLSQPLFIRLCCMQVGGWNSG